MRSGHSRRSPDKEGYSDNAPSSHAPNIPPDRASQKGFLSRARCTERAVGLLLFHRPQDGKRGRRFGGNGGGCGDGVARDWEWVRPTNFQCGSPPFSRLVDMAFSGFFEVRSSGRLRPVVGVGRIIPPGVRSTTGGRGVARRTIGVRATPPWQSVRKPRLTPWATIPCTSWVRSGNWGAWVGGRRGSRSGGLERRQEASEGQGRPSENAALEDASCGPDAGRCPGHPTCATRWKTAFNPLGHHPLRTSWVRSGNWGAHGVARKAVPRRPAASRPKTVLNPLNYHPLHKLGSFGESAVAQTNAPAIATASLSGWASRSVQNASTAGPIPRPLRSSGHSGSRA